MGTIQEQCEECFNCSNMDEIEFKKEHIDNLKLGLSPKVNTQLDISSGTVVELSLDFPKRFALAITTRLLVPTEKVVIDTVIFLP